MADEERPSAAGGSGQCPVAPRRGELRVFLAKVAAVTLAALVVLFAAGNWLVPGGRPADAVVPWRQAARHIGQYVTVEGTIVGTHNSGKACFLNFDPDWRRAFSAVIFAARFDAFPARPEDHYRGKKVRVTGLIREYQGRPEMILESPDQIEVTP
jgi:hypothetical protein